MKKGYWVVAYRSISDESALKVYGALAAPAEQSFGGRFLARAASAVQAHEAGLPLRTVIFEFDSYDIALGLAKAKLTKRPLRRSDLARNATSASLRVRSQCRPARALIRQSFGRAENFTASNLLFLKSIR